MNHNIYTEFNVQVDMALEARDLVRGTTGREIAGVEEQVKELPNSKITIITIKDQSAAQIMGKPIGTYITIEVQRLRFKDPEVQEEVSDALAQCLNYMTSCYLTPQSNVLLIGLGNWKATPESLGPRVVEFSPITRHLHKYAPDALIQGMRPVCGLAPGVLGTTGIETNEIIKGIVENVKPDLLIVVDALAAQSTERIGTSIQISIPDPTRIRGRKRAGTYKPAVTRNPGYRYRSSHRSERSHDSQSSYSTFLPKQWGKLPAASSVKFHPLRFVLFWGQSDRYSQRSRRSIDNAASIVSTGIAYALSRASPKTVLVIIRPDHRPSLSLQRPRSLLYLRPSLSSSSRVTNL